MADQAISDFERVASPWAEEVHFLPRSSIPSVAYHYTDAAGLVGILKGGKIWATDHRFLNDKSEVVHTQDTVKSLVLRRMESTEDPLLLNFYREILQQQGHETEANKFFFSLSEEADDLSQWRGYAREGQGFTIGFSGPELFKVAEPRESPFSFMKIEYDHEKQRDCLNRALDDLERALKKAAAQKDASPEALAQEAAIWFAWVGDVRALTNKHSSFRSEREWRIVSLVPQNSGDGDIKVRSSGLRLIQYTEVSVSGEDGKLPIVRIGIGPGFAGREEVHAVRSLCRETGYDPEIYFADTPYRRT